jgi:hypothetical protein
VAYVEPPKDKVDLLTVVIVCTMSGQSPTVVVLPALVIVDTCSTGQRGPMLTVPSTHGRLAHPLIAEVKLIVLEDVDEEELWK